jgi:LysR family transcriptional regulator, glycine cleavage system transcriptional activator
MSRRLPPLNSLRAFEAVARHLSISRAAEELSVTPAAVSHQIKTLEDHLGVALFRRDKRSLMLSDAGQACLPGIREGFERLGSAIAEIDSLGLAGILTVSVAPSFAAKWLLPRLDGFQAKHPDIDVRVSASMQLVDFTRDDVDLAIRYGSGRYPELVVERLMTEAVFPVCSPKLMKGKDGLTSLEALRSQTLLHDDSPDGDVSCPTWAMWLKAAGVDEVDASRGPRFNQSSLVLEAAILGRGVALAKAALAAADLAEGRLVRPFEIAAPVDFAYYVVCPKAKLNLPKVALFRDWLRAQAAENA